RCCARLVALVGATESAWKSGRRYGPISGRQALGATAWAQGFGLPLGATVWAQGAQRPSLSARHAATFPLVRGSRPERSERRAHRASPGERRCSPQGRWPREIGAAIPLIDVLKSQTARALAGTVVAEETHFGVLAIVSTDDVDHRLGRQDVGEI